MQILRRSRSRRAPRLAPRLLATGAAVTATAAIGSLATGPAVRSPEYTQLDKPSWQPPGVAFPIVWTGLYTVIACSSALALTNLARHREERRPRSTSSCRRSGRGSPRDAPARCPGSCVAAAPGCADLWA